jgi:D-glycero-alpha-D-manno-heptose-7-phosphate kinase
MILTRTPYRLSLFGGGTDYPAWFENNPSKCISAAMANYCYIYAKKLPPFFEHTIRLGYSKVESVSNVNDIEHPSIRVCLKHLDLCNDISIGFDGELPARSGIGSSSSFTVGLLKALYALKGQSLSPRELATDAIYVEQTLIGENVGIQDQIMASYGGIQIIHMGPGIQWQTEKVILSDTYQKELESHIMLGFSGVSRIAEIQAKKQVERIKEGLNTNLLVKMSEITNEAIESIQKEQSIDEIGKLMDKAWRIKRILTDGITDELLDTIYVQSIANGSLGTKLMGAGGGGFFMFLVPPNKQEEFKKQMKQIKVWVPFEFDNHGSQIILK